jgi:hypothetical protein
MVSVDLVMRWLRPRASENRDRDKPWVATQRPAWVNPGVSAVEVVGELVVEDTGADLEQEARAGGVQRICSLLTVRSLTTVLTVDSYAMETASPAR